MKSAFRRWHFAIAFRAAAGWLLCADLIYAPLDYGGVTERSIVALDWSLGAAVLLWVVGSFAATRRRAENVERRTPNVERSRDSSRAPENSSATRPPLFAISPSLLALCTFVLLLGWGMVLNAKAIYDSDHYIFVALVNWVPHLPGSIDQAVSMASMVRVTVLLGAILMVAEMVRDPRWLLRLWWTVGLVGGLIALLGLIQKASGAPMIFWREVEHPVATFFGTFYYHGNAGAFLNLTLPATLGLAVRAFMRPGQPLIRALWLTLSVSSMVAAFSNTSRMSQALAGGILLILATGFLPKAIRTARTRFEWSTALAGGIAILLALFTVVETSRIDRALARWERTNASTVVDRWSPARAAWRAIPEAGWSGFGPGTFAIVFPYYTSNAPELIGGRWLYLHEDYVQTVLEWGWVGSGFLACLFFGGMAVAMRNGWRAKRTRIAEGGLRTAESGSQWTPRQRLLLPLVLLSLASVALHALVDFPLQIFSIQLYVAAYLGICWGSEGWKFESRKEKGKANRGLMNLLL